MPFVADASITASWALLDEDHPLAQAALDRLRGDEALVPFLWWFEVRNTLLASERRGRITEAGTAGFLTELGELPIRLDHSPDGSRVFQIARKHRLTIYDAAYLELAERERVPLATLDKDLAKAAARAGVPLLS